MSKFGKFMSFFGVKFGLSDLLCVKHLTLCNSGWRSHDCKIWSSLWPKSFYVLVGYKIGKPSDGFEPDLEFSSVESMPWTFRGA